MNNSGIYKITNTLNGKIYIGSTINIKSRWDHHLNSLIRGDHHSSHLQKSWNKYGQANFIFSVIEVVDDYTKLIEREQYYIDSLNSCNIKIGYNISPTAGNCLGIKRTDETKQKLRDINIGKTKSDDTKQKISEGLKNSLTWKESVTSDEFKEKMRDLNLGENNPMWGREGVKGEEHHMWGKFGKLHHRARKILQYKKNGEFVKEWDSFADIERILMFDHSNVSSCCAGRIKSAYGFVWNWK